MERQFGPYTLIKQIAVGGMAEIQLARTEGIAGFEKYVAIKMIHPNLSEDEQFIQMLIDEAKITVQLAHVNIAQTFDLGRVGKTYYITMEFVEGCDLYKLLRSGSEMEIDTPVNVAAFIAKEAATGLDYAHRKRDVMGRPLQIVHRDVSPQNLLISSVGEVKVIDFGIAKATMRAQHTEVGVIKGKYYYMSPEQAWGEPLDARTDVFSTGIILYELLTGQMLYLEEDLHTLLDMVREANIAPPSTLRRDIPPQLEAIVMKALQKNADDRYNTAGEMAADLERFLHKHTPLFSSGTVTAWTQQVLADEDLVPNDQQMPERDRKAVTQGLGRERILSPEDEFNDENSIIFRVDEEEARIRAAEMENEERDFDQKTGVVESMDELFQLPDSPFHEAESERQIGDSTKAITGPPPANSPMFSVTPPHLANNTPLPELYPDEGDEIEERTMVSAPPGFEAPTLRPSKGFMSAATLSTDIAQMPPSMAPAPLPGQRPAQNRRQVPKINPLMSKEKNPQTAPRVAAIPDLQSAKTTIPSRTRSKATTPKPTTRKQDQSDILEAITSVTEPNAVKTKADWQRSNPLTDSNPKPAVSALKPARKSRRTPPQGVPAQPAPSVLSNLLTNTQKAQVALSEANHTNAAVPLTPSQAAPIQLQTPQTQSPARPQQFQAPLQPAQTPPLQSHQPLYTPGPAAQHYPPQPQGHQPNWTPAQPQHGYNTPNPLGGFPSVPGLPTHAQMAALEVDELPDAYRLNKRSPRTAWLFPVVGFLVLAVAAAAAAYFLLTDKSASTGGQLTTVTIVSIPEGVSVSVDGKVLAGKTPITWDEAVIGQSYDFSMRKKGYKRWEKSHTIGQQRETLTARLDQILVTLTVTSKPTGANVYLNGNKNAAGTTPLLLENMDPANLQTVEVRKEGYAPVKRTLDWTNQDSKTEPFLLSR